MNLMKSSTWIVISNGKLQKVNFIQLLILEGKQSKHMLSWMGKLYLFLLYLDFCFKCLLNFSKIKQKQHWAHFFIMPPCLGKTGLYKKINRFNKTLLGRKKNGT